jgi:uncharacterized membrane protein
MNLETYRTLFVVGSLILVLATAFPGLSLVFSFPKGEETFTELWVLGSGHLAEDYPFNVGDGGEYSVYVGLGNHMGSSSFYNVRVKFRNQNEPLPNATTGIPSSLPTLYEEMVFVEDAGNWETPLNFSFSGVSFSGNHCRVKSLKINDILFDVNKSVPWDEENNGFYYQLFIELWIYQVGDNTFQFHNRFVGIWLNMTGV